MKTKESANSTIPTGLVKYSNNACHSNRNLYNGTIQSIIATSHFQGDYMTTNYTFPCASVNGLTLNQKREAIAALRASIKADRANRSAATAQKRADREAAKLAKAAAAVVKREAAIAKAQARLQKLLDKQSAPVGTKAIKANKKPGAVKITKFQEDARVANDIAMALAAKRKSA
jgi:hypothetical protein